MDELSVLAEFKKATDDAIAKLDAAVALLRGSREPYSDTVREALVNRFERSAGYAYTDHSGDELMLTPETAADIVVNSDVTFGPFES